MAAIVNGEALTSVGCLPHRPGSAPRGSITPRFSPAAGPGGRRLGRGWEATGILLVHHHLIRIDGALLGLLPRRSRPRRVRRSWSRRPGACGCPARMRTSCSRSTRRRTRWRGRPRRRSRRTGSRDHVAGCRIDAGDRRIRVVRHPHAVERERHEAGFGTDNDALRHLVARGIDPSDGIVVLAGDPDGAVSDRQPFGRRARVDRRDDLVCRGIDLRRGVVGRVRNPHRALADRRLQRNRADLDRGDHLVRHRVDPRDRTVLERGELGVHDPYRPSPAAIPIGSPPTSISTTAPEIGRGPVGSVGDDGAGEPGSLDPHETVTNAATSPSGEAADAAHAGVTSHNITRDYGL